MPTSPTTSPTASIIVIGNEILSGRTQDKNLHWLAGELSKIGIKTVEASVIPDIESVIVDTVNTHRPKYDYIFTSGGIGPTHDDITSAAIAKAFNTTLERNAKAADILLKYYGKEHLTEPRLKMADIPKGAVLIPNPVSGAPGFTMENVYVMAGVPAIFQAMFSGIKHHLAGGPPILSSSTTAFIAESMIAIALGNLQTDYSTLEIGSYPFTRDGTIGTRLVITGTDSEALNQATEKLHLLLDNKKVDYQCDSPPH